MVLWKARGVILETYMSLAGYLYSVLKLVAGVIMKLLRDTASTFFNRYVITPPVNISHILSV